MSLDQFLLSADTTDLNYPEIRPTLDLNFARVKALDPRITFTRASGGSYVGADGLIKYAGVNEPRFDHDLYTGESLGFLVEEARTNYVGGTGGSALFAGYNFNTESIWTITAASTDVSAPDGSSLTTKAVSGSSGNTYFWKYTNILFTHASNTTYTQSVWARVAVGTGSISVTSYPFGQSYYGYGQGNDITTEWKRISLTYTTDSGPSEPPYMGVVSPSDNTTFYFWGWQIEEGAFPTSYIPTVGSSRTRAADLASITGKNFSSWYRQDEGSIMMNAKIQEVQNGTTKQVFIFEGNTSTQRILDVYTFSSNVTYRDFYVDNNGVNGISVSNFTANVFQKFARSYGGNNMSAVTAGIVNGTTSTTIPTTIQQLGIFAGISYGTGFGTLSGTISRLTYYPKRLPDAQLQVLTR